MPVQKIDPKVIFASNAPAIDKPPVFSDKTKGWDVARANDGRPEIKQMNKVQQDTDLKILWLNENAVLPYDSTIDYPDGAVTLKDGSFKQLSSGLWVEFLDDFADKAEVNAALSDLNKGVDKFYPTLAEANADIANIAVNQPVNISESQNFGLWYKATAGATTLTKSPYDPLTQAKADATTKANAAEANANTRTGINFDFYSLFVETQFVEVDKNFRIVREIEKGYKPDGSGGSDGGDESAVIVLDFYSNFKEKSSALVVISNNNKVLLKMASDGSEIFNANNLKNNVSPDVTHIEHTFLKKRLAEHPIAAKFNYHRSNDGTVANFPSLIQVYEMYDELMSRHSDSMTKITLGTDATGLPIYCYIVKPKPYLAVRFTDEQLKHPKVVISGAIHGDERPAQVGCAVFTAQLLDEHMKRERYATLRHACEFHIIPAINPWGANNFNRMNSNSVDINRDFGDGLFVQAESQIMRDYVLSLDNVMLFLDMHQSQSPDYLLWLGATRPKSRELTKAFSVESLKYFHANVRPEVTTQYSFQIAANGDNTMCQYFSNQGIESILIESPVMHEAIGDATVVRDFVTETYVIAINEFYQNFKQLNANTAI